MIAFIKRRWVLLSFLLLFIACTSVYWVWSGYRAVAGGFREGQFGISGTIFWYEFRGLKTGNNIAAGYSAVFKFRAPRFRQWVTPAPRNPLMRELIRVNPNNLDGVFIPLWIPIAVILGWIVIRELRWREKRANAVE